MAILSLLLLTGSFVCAWSTPSVSDLSDDTPADPDEFMKLMKAKLSNKTLGYLKKGLRGVDPVQRLAKMRAYAANHPIPKLTAKQQQDMQNILKQIGPIPANQSAPAADDIFEQNRKSGLAEFMVEADILPTDAQLAEMDSSDGRKKRNAIAWGGKWAGNIIYYELDPEISANAGKVWMINEAHKFIQERTCIRFQASATAANRIWVIKDTGCYSQLGMTGDIQTLSLADGCGELHGTIVHEFTHALGFWHTQNRVDRNDWITVNTNNINLPPDQISMNFDRRSADENINYTPYEYGSVMHYPPNLFAKPNTLTFVPKWPRHLYTMGTRSITFYDMKMINDRYGCHAKCPAATSAPCGNGGYPNPNNCQACVCPPGYGGGWCLRRPGCGAELVATTAWKSQFIQFGQNNQVQRKMFSYCTHWIKAPAGAKIQVKMTALNYPQCVYGCQNNGFEIKLGDARMHGIRVCCPSKINEVFEGTLNPMPIISHNRQYLTSYTIQYRYVAAGG